ncbi:MAG: hypothetical protein AVDCRST_MAG73-2678, partial [uncultured Thermomicrobiales bacterium]
SGSSTSRSGSPTPRATTSPTPSASSSSSPTRRGWRSSGSRTSGTGCRPTRTRGAPSTCTRRCSAGACAPPSSSTPTFGSGGCRGGQRSAARQG